MRRFLLRLLNLFRGQSAESEMSGEMTAHLALLQENFERNGLSPQEAALSARRAYGGASRGAVPLPAPRPALPLLPF